MAPLISFYVIACNQERLVSQAIASAFAQTWTPLEIVLSDDCSDDRTFEVMQDLAGTYVGPHSIVINRNRQRLGVGAHINRVLQLSKGDWIVASAGDDVSLPERTKTLYSLWELAGKRHGLLYSNLVETHEDGSVWYSRDFRKEVPGGWEGEELSWDWRERLLGRCPPVHGASFAYPRRTLDDFGLLWDGVVFEDNIFNWRAELSGGVLLCPDYLVRHRNHSGQFTNLYSKQALIDADNRRRKLRWSNVVTFRQNLADANIALANGFIDRSTFNSAARHLAQQVRAAELDYELFWGSIVTRWRILLSDFTSLLGRKRLTELLFAALPRPLYLIALRAVAAQRSMFPSCSGWKCKPNPSRTTGGPGAST